MAGSPATGRGGARRTRLTARRGDWIAAPRCRSARLQRPRGWRRGRCTFAHCIRGSAIPTPAMRTTKRVVKDERSSASFACHLQRHEPLPMRSTHTPWANPLHYSYASFEMRDRRKKRDAQELEARGDCRKTISHHSKYTRISASVSRYLAGLSQKTGCSVPRAANSARKYWGTSPRVDRKSLCGRSLC